MIYFAIIKHGGYCFVVAQGQSYRKIEAKGYRYWTVFMNMYEMRNRRGAPPEFYITKCV